MPLKKQVRNTAHTIARAVTELTKQKFPVGHAQEVVARLYGFKDYNALAHWLKPETVLAELMDAESVHVRSNPVSENGREFRLMAQGGRTLCVPEYPLECSYVRIEDRAGHEVAYWVADEWKDDPETVMGAIVGALAGSDGAQVPAFAPDAPGPLPDIKALDLGRVDTVVIDDEPWQVICVQVQGAAEHLWSQGADATDDCDTVFDVYCLDEDLNVVTQAIDAETIRSLKWSVADGAYRDAGGRLFRFFESTPVR